MKSIYYKHTTELNKWMDVHLDRMESPGDCRALITQPVADAIEFDRSQVDFIVNYCDGNPYYMQVFCSQVFQRCWQDSRTYVGEGEVQEARAMLVRTLGDSSFAHFWSDNPVLDPEDHARFAAENALVLTCLARVGGNVSDTDALVEIQQDLELQPIEQLSDKRFRITVERLRLRGVLNADSVTGALSLGLPFFKDWLTERAELSLLPILEGLRGNHDRLRLIGKS